MLDLVRVSVAPHPLKAARDSIEMPAGMTLADMIRSAQPDPVLHRWCHVEIDGVPVDRDKLHLIRPKAGRLVTIRVAPGKSDKGGGKNPLQTVLTIAVVAAAIAVSAGALGPLLGVAALGPGTWGAMALGGAIGAIGMAMLPTPKTGNMNSTARVADVRDSPSQSIEGARNSANLWGVVPDVLGRHRVVPPYAAQPFTAPNGSSQYLHMLFAWAVGEVEVDDFRIGETPVSDYEEITVQTLYGTSEDNPSLLSAYRKDRAEEAFAITLTQPVSYVSRTTADEADLISIDLTLPQGLVKFDNQGNRQNHTVTLRVRYRLVGESAYIVPAVELSQTFPSTWSQDVNGEYLEIVLRGKTTAAIRHGLSWRPPARGQYEVEVRRASADTTSTQIFDTVVWTALRRLKNSNPVAAAYPLARSAVRVRATDQLNSVIDTFSGIVHRVTWDWDDLNEVWVWRATSNPASMFRHVLTGPANARPVPIEQIDLPQLQHWHEFCVTEGLECNLVIDFPSSVREVLQLVCGTGRASLDNKDGKWSVVIDRPAATPVQHFTPRNSRGFRAEKLWPDRSHAWRVRFNDRAHDWRAGERVVYDEGYTAGTATKFEQHDFVGVTRASQAVKLARHQLRAQLLQPESWEFEVDFEHLVANRGDLVLVTHDVLLVGLASGRVKALSTSGGSITGFTSDEALPMEAGKSYGVSVRTVADADVTAQVVTAAGEQTAVTFTTPLAAGSIAAGDLFGFGELGAETVRGQVKQIRRSADLAARVTLLPYSDALFNLSLPADFDPGMTPLFQVPAPVIRTVYTGGAALGREPDATLVRVVLEVEPIERQDAILDVQARPTETGESYRTAEVVSRPEANIVVLGGMRIGEYWDLRARWVAGPLQPGPWGYRSGVVISGYEQAESGAVVGVLANLTLSALGNQALLRWDPPSTLDAKFGGTAHFRHSPFQVGATWANSTSIGRGVPAANQVVNLPLKGGTYLGRIIDAAGRPGAITSVSTKQHNVHPYNTVLSWNEDPDWDGVMTGTEVGVGGVLQMSGVFTPGVGGFGDLGDVAISGTYDFEVVVDLLTVKRVRATTYLDAASVNMTEMIDDRQDLIDNWTDFDGGVDQGEADAQVWVRITDDDPGLATSPWTDGSGFTDGTTWTDLAGGGGATWKLYQRLDSAEFEARGFDFQLRMASRDPAFNMLVSELRIDIQEIAA